MKIIHVFCLQSLAYHIQNIPRAISFQNEVRRKLLAGKEYSTDRCLFKGEKLLIELFHRLF